MLFRSKRGGFRFVETSHIKDVLAHLRIVANPQDAVSWHRTLLLLEGIGPKSSEEIVRWVVEGPDPAARLREFPRPALSTPLRALANLLERVRDSEAPEQQAEEVLGYYEPMLKRLHRDDHPKRRKDLDHFVALAARYRTLDSLLVDLARSSVPIDVRQVRVNPSQQAGGGSGPGGGDILTGPQASYAAGDGMGGTATRPHDVVVELRGTVGLAPPPDPKVLGGAEPPVGGGT